MTSHDMEPVRAAGGCLCGAVRYQIRGALRDVWNCHCGQCRRAHGHVAAYSSVARDALELTEDRGLKWYVSSESARRGFCGDCGASVFWEPQSSNAVSVAAGTLDAPTGLRTTRHVFVGHKGDYYEIEDDLERFAGAAGS